MDARSGQIAIMPAAALEFRSQDYEDPMAEDLSEATNVPYVYTKTSVATTYTEFKLPPWCCRVTIVASKAAWVSFTGAATPSDGGSTGAHKAGIPQDTGAVFVIQDPEQRPIRTGLTYARSVFVASQGGTCTVCVILEAGLS